MKTWVSKTNLIGRKMNFKKVEDDEIRAITVFDIDCDGGIKVKFENGEIKKFYSGEISLTAD